MFYISCSTRRELPETEVVGAFEALSINQSFNNKLYMYTGT